jgi:phenylpyruvate tautomerase PptA (4-oxalocrotonate tautomerase family)
MLITNLPGRNQTLRMRIWRALKAAGAALLRDGVYVLPFPVPARRVFEEQRMEIQAAKGGAYVLPFESDSPAQNGELMTFFDRTAEYQALKLKLDVYTRSVAKLSEVDARRRLAAIARDATAIDAIDFFEGKSQTQMKSSLADALTALNARFSPNEPQAVHAKIPRRDPKNYQGRTWATREHPD